MAKYTRKELEALTDKELYRIHEDLYGEIPILRGRGFIYPQNLTERKMVIDAIIEGEPLDLTKDDPPDVLY